MLQRLHAGVLLALSLVKTLFIRYLLPSPKDGLASFHEKFSQDRLLPVSPRHREIMPDMTGCIACGRCASGAGLPSGAHPLSFVLSGLRSMPEYDAAVKLVENLSDEQLDELQEQCPAQLPFKEAVYFVREQAQSLEHLSGKAPRLLTTSSS